MIESKSMPPKRTEEPAPPWIPAGATILGVDVGGTKTRIDLVGRKGHQSRLIPSQSWRKEADTVRSADMISLADQIRGFLAECDGGPDTDQGTIALCLGLHGADSPRQLSLADRTLSANLPGWRLRVVNDAELLGPAAGIDRALNLVVGTGTVAVGRSADDSLLRADGYGYGWLLSDFGSAPALVREAVREIIRRSTVQGEKAAMEDPFTQNLLTRLEAHDLYQLTVAFGSLASEKAWGDMAPLFFSSLESGSVIADRTLDQAVERLGQSISSIVSRGALGDQVVAAGGVITHQPVMAERLSKLLDGSCGRPLHLCLLQNPPALGALRLARDLLFSRV